MKKLLPFRSAATRGSRFLTGLLLAGALLFSERATAQSTVQVGSGTTTTLYGPIYIFSASSTNKYSYSMTIYSQADIIAAGGMAGLIDQISWNKTNAGAYTTNDASFEIYMKNTTETGFTTASDLTTELANATAVYNSTTASLPAASGWVDFALSTPFNWNGTDNLMVLTKFNRPGNATGEVRWEASNAASSIKMSFSAAGNYTSHYIYANRPNVKLRISAPAGIADAANTINLALYPNPAQHELFLNFGLKKTGEAVEVLVNDLTGKTVLRDAFKNATALVNRRYNLNGLNAGLYLVQVKTSEGISVKKLVVE